METVLPHVIYCTGLAKNETIPEPVLPTPRVASTKEREQGVQISILPNSAVSEEKRPHTFIHTQFSL